MFYSVQTLKSVSQLASLDETENISKEGGIELLKTTVVQEVHNHEQYGCLQDKASTNNFVTHSKAKAYGLSGHDVVVEIEGINNVQTFQTVLYKVPIKTLNGDIRIIKCFGLDSIQMLTHQANRSTGPS